MNFIRGIDRIGLIVAVLAVPIGFGIGYEYTSEKYKKVTPAYQAWENEYGDVTVKNPSSPLYGTVVRPFNRPDPPEKYEYPERWKAALGGGLLSVVFFFGTLVAVRFSSRGLKKLSLWVINGFRNK